MWGLRLFAQMSTRGSDPLRSPEVMWSTLGLAVALLAGALLVYLADRWRKGSAARAADAASELTEFRRMYDRGEITEAEYAKLRDKVAQRVKAPPPAPVSQASSASTILGPLATNPLPGPDQPTPPPDSGKPSNPSPPA